MSNGSNRRWTHKNFPNIHVSIPKEYVGTTWDNNVSWIEVEFHTELAATFGPWLERWLKHRLHLPPAYPVINGWEIISDPAVRDCRLLLRDITTATMRFCGIIYLLGKHYFMVSPWDPAMEVIHTWQYDWTNPTCFGLIAFGQNWQMGLMSTPSVCEIELSKMLFWWRVCVANLAGICSLLSCLPGLEEDIQVLFLSVVGQAPTSTHKHPQTPASTRAVAMIMSFHETRLNESVTNQFVTAVWRVTTKTAQATRKCSVIRPTG